MYFGPKNYEEFAPFDAHAKLFGGHFGCLEPAGTFVYELNTEGSLPMDLSDETEEKLLGLIEKSAVEGKDLVYEAFKDKAFDPYPDPDADY